MCQNQASSSSPMKADVMVTLVPAPFSKRLTVEMLLRSRVGEHAPCVEVDDLGSQGYLACPQRAALAGSAVLLTAMSQVVGDWDCWRVLALSFLSSDSARCDRAED